MDQKNFNVIQINANVKLMCLEIIVTCVDLVIGIWKDPIQMDVQVEFFVQKFKKKFIFFLKNVMLKLMEQFIIEVVTKILAKIIRAKKTLKAKGVIDASQGFMACQKNKMDVQRAIVQLDFHIWTRVIQSLASANVNLVLKAKTVIR